jgi:hypothetical protein
MDKLEEKQVDTTGSFTLTCLECEFKETIWGSLATITQIQKYLTHVKSTAKVLNIKKS